MQNIKLELEKYLEVNLEAANKENIIDFEYNNIEPIRKSLVKESSKKIENEKDAIEPPKFLGNIVDKDIIADDTDINQYIKDHKAYSDFQTLLFKYIDERNLKDSDVYNKVHIDRKLFSKIRSYKDYHPSKKIILLLAISLELSEAELDQLLESASYSLPKNNTQDLIIRFCFIKKIFKISKINKILEEYQCNLFEY